jgi:hypothetical protein
LFTCANANQVANAVPVAEDLLERGIACRFMMLDPVYQQAAAPSIAGSPVAGRATWFTAPASGLPKPFAMLPLWQRWIAVHRRRSEMIAAAGDHSGVVAGMDGAFERLVIRRYRGAHRFTAILWDGFTTPQPRVLDVATSTGRDAAWRLRLWWHVAGRRTLLRAASRLGGEAYVPGLPGHTHVGVLYTAGRFVTEAFQSQGVKTPIETTGIPRFAPLCGRTPASAVNRRSAVYVTGAFLWHHNAAFDRCQQRDLDALAAALPSRGWQLTIRVHPREDRARYIRFTGQPGVTISESSDVPLWDLLSSADVVIASVSTAGFEALALGRPLVVYLGTFPAAARDISLGAHPGLPLARTPDQLVAALERVGGVAGAAAMSSVLDDFVDPGTAHAARRIADSIVAHLA